jgi:hypothetical protein
MDMKTKLFALAGMPVLSLFAAVTLAADAEPPDLSDYATAIDEDVLKNQKDCSKGKFFKNAFPSLTNGTPGGSTTIDFTVEGKTVPMTVTWESDNSFAFELDGGIAHVVSVTVDTNNFTYRYATPVIADGFGIPPAPPKRLNSYSDGTVAGDVNHLDLCLGTLDTEAPGVTITYPQDGGTAPVGLVTITATVTDNEGLSSVTASVEGGSLTGTVLLGDGTPSQTVSDQYEWTWNAIDLLPGPYTIEVTAIDTATPTANTTANTTIVVSDFELIISAASCVGFRLEDDPEEGEGCNPTGKVNIQVPPVNNFNNGPDGCDAQNGEVCTITGNLLKPDPLTVANLAALDPPCEACSVCPADSFPDPRMSNNGGRWVPTDFRPLVVFDELGLSADSPSFPDGALILNQYTFGFPCLVIAKHNKNWDLNVGFLSWPNEDDPTTPGDEATGLVFAKTHFPERVVLPSELRPACYGVDGNFDLQEASRSLDRCVLQPGTRHGEK